MTCALLSKSSEDALLEEQTRILVAVREQNVQKLSNLMHFSHVAIFHLTLRFGFSDDMQGSVCLTLRL